MHFITKMRDIYYGVKSRVVCTPVLKRDVFILITIALISTGAFLIIEISAQDVEVGESLKIVQTASVGNVGMAGGTGALAGGGAYVASRSGEVFYLPWCGGVKRIKEENKVWFKTKEDAIAKGYRPAGNCKGI